MKIKTALFTIALVLVANIANAYTIRYQNDDSNAYKMEVRSNGNTQIIEFCSLTTSSTSVQTSALEIEIKTECGWLKVKDGARIKIKMVV